MGQGGVVVGVQAQRSTGCAAQGGGQWLCTGQRGRCVIASGTEAMSNTPPFRCQVFAADMIGVISGAAQGEPLRPPPEVFAGDIYRLAPDAAPLTLALDTGAEPPVVAPGSAVGRAGEAVAAAGRLTLMAPDGARVTLELLRVGDALLALPLSPMRARLDYTLIAADDAAESLRLSDLACASFVRGTRIARPGGTLAQIEDLHPSDMVLTRDNGAQPLRWLGRTVLRAEGALAPVEFAPGVLGNADVLRLNPYHRVFLYQRGAGRLTGRAEVLVQARFLVDGESVRRREGGFVEYFSLAFDAHEIVYAEGTPVESLLVSHAMAARLEPGMAEELRDRFPGLAQHPHIATEPDSAPHLLRASAMPPVRDKGN